MHVWVSLRRCYDKKLHDIIILGDFKSFVVLTMLDVAKKLMK